MKSTGIVRRIDDLGRVVIPKEIRRKLKIQEGDALEIYLDEKEKIVAFGKYKPYSDNWEKIEKIVEPFFDNFRLLDEYGEVQIDRNKDCPIEDLCRYRIDDDDFIKIGYLEVPEQDSTTLAKQVVQIIKSVLEIIEG